ncbi:MAG: hypothetical protein ACLFTB_06970 [Desulfovibrionales bacterium]
MVSDKKELIEALTTSIKHLQQGIDTHCCLVTSILNGHVDERTLRRLTEGCPGKSREMMLREAIREAIEVLEASRKAFKSKQLEALRKKLTNVLIEAR